MKSRTILLPVLLTMFFACCHAAAAAQGDRTVKTLVRSDNLAAPKPDAPLTEVWLGWSPRDEIAPRFSVDHNMPVHRSSGGRGVMCIEAGDDPASLGAWRRRVGGITGGKTYRFAAYYRTKDVKHPGRSVFAQLGWLDAKGERLRLPDIAADVETAKDGWTRAECVATAPEKAQSVEMELSLAWSPGGTVWWDDITLTEAEAGAAASSPRRAVRAMTIYHRPQGTGDAAKSVAQFVDVIEKAAAQKPDIICLPEGITVIGTGKSYAAVSEPIPGPTTRTLGELAKKLSCYIVAGIYEREGKTIYNTAVLMGRKGELVGKYRKTHLPQAEVEGGLTPGDSYPVFQTDFGKVGLLICWDVQFPEPARALALAGAEMILLPIWGGSETLARARAIENHVFLVTSSFDMKTFIVDPTGEVKAEATKDHPAALAVIDLGKRIIQPWLGDMGIRTWKERRADLPIEPVRR